MNEPHRNASTKKERLFAIVQRVASPKYPLTVSTSIATDLGIDGDEANSLIQQISQEFDVDLSEIDSRYFVDEFEISYGVALLPFAPLIWLGMFITGKGKKVELLVGDLLNAVESGRWQHPEREAIYPWQRHRKHTSKFK